MPIVISADGKVYDRTDELLEVPDNNYVTSALGLFTDKPSTQRHIQLVRRNYQANLVPDRNWEERNSNTVGGVEDYINLSIAHFPLDDAITPNDVQGIASIDFAQAGLTGIVDLETVANVRAHKMVKLRADHALTMEAARMQMITTGTVYSPRATNPLNMYTEFGVTQTSVTVDFSGVTNPISVVRGAIATSRDALFRAGMGGGLQGFVVLCSSSFFEALLANPYVNQTAQIPPGNFAILDGTGNPVPGLDARYSSINRFGATWIDAGVGGYAPNNGAFVPFIPEGEAYIVPRGVANLFQTYYAPASRFEFVNRPAQTSYWFEYLNQEDSKIKIMTEQNFLNVCLNPAAIVKLELA